MSTYSWTIEAETTYQETLCGSVEAESEEEAREKLSTEDLSDIYEEIMGRQVLVFDYDLNDLELRKLNIKEKLNG